MQQDANSDDDIIVVELFASTSHVGIPSDAVVFIQEEEDGTTSAAGDESWTRVTVEDSAKKGIAELKRTFDDRDVIRFRLGRVQRLKAIVHERNDPKAVFGICECLVSELIMAPKQTLMLSVKPIPNYRADAISSSSQHTPMSDDFVEMRMKDVSEHNRMIDLKLIGEGLEKKDLLGLSDPYLCIYQVREDTSRVRVFTTEVIKQTLNPHFSMLRISTQRICRGDKARPIVIECWDWDRNTSHDFIGEFRTNVQQLLQDQRRQSARKSFTSAQYPLLNPNKLHNDGYIHSGLLGVAYAYEHLQPESLQFISRGIKVTLAVDFSGSCTLSMHSDEADERDTMTPAKRALHQFAKVLLPYSKNDEQLQRSSEYDLSFWAFGCKFTEQDKLWHQIDISPHDNDVQGSSASTVKGEQNELRHLMRAYDEVRAEARPSAPSLFAPVLAETILSCPQADLTGSRRHSLLVIFSDGVANDLPELINGIVAASSMPLSIIVFRIGCDHFEEMDAIDSNQQDPLQSTDGVEQKLRLVRVHNWNCFSDQVSLSDTVSKALEDIPKHMVEHHMWHTTVKQKRHRRSQLLSLSQG